MEKNMKDEKIILDACCGGRMFWFNKHQPNTIYIDNNPRPKGTISIQKGWECEPDIVMDFRDLKFEDKKFKLVIFDPPHMRSLQETSIMRKKYGSLNAETWQSDLKKGFKECWRVLDDYGVLIFKWGDNDSRSPPLSKVLELFEQQPLFGHNTGLKTGTHWLCFMKLPKIPSQTESSGISDPR